MTPEMLKELIELKAKEYKVKSLTLEFTKLEGFPTLILRALDMPDGFIIDVQKCCPVHVDMKFFINKDSVGGYL